MRAPTVALGAAAVAFTALAEWAIGSGGWAALVDAAAGLAFLLVGVVLRTGAARYSLACAAAGVAWLLASWSPGAMWLHRPLIVWVVLAFPDGRLRSRGAIAGVLASACVAIPGVATVGWVMAVVGAGVACLGVAELRRTRGWPNPSARARGWAALATGSAFLLPFAAHIVANSEAAVVPPAAQEFGYTALIALAGLVLLAAAWGRDRREAEGVIALAEDGDTATTLAELRARDRGGDPPTQRAVDSAIALLERNIVAQRHLAAAVEESRRSRRRLVEATVVERRVLRRKLAERVRPLLPEVQATLSRISTDDEAIAPLLERCRAEVVGIGADLDALADGLHPAHLTESGLAAVEEMLAEGPIDVAVHLPSQRYPLEVEAATWYACAEAVTNAIKHGHASRVQIEGSQDGGWLTVEIRDDGVGGAVLSERGGLAGLADRVAALDGRLGVESVAGQGTTVRVRLPVP